MFSSIVLSILRRSDSVELSICPEEVANTEDMVEIEAYLVFSGLSATFELHFRRTTLSHVLRSLQAHKLPLSKSWWMIGSN